MKLFIVKLVLFSTVLLHGQNDLDTLISEFRCKVNFYSPSLVLVQTFNNTLLRFSKAPYIAGPPCDTIGLPSDSGAVTSSMWANYCLHFYMDSDSTFRECGGGWPGKLFSTDSIYLWIKFCTNPGYYEYFGKRVPTISSGVKNTNAEEANLSVFPNPGTGKFTIHIPVQFIQNEKTVISVYDLYGDEVLQKTVNISDKILDLSGHSKGMYIYKVKVGEKNYSGKLVLQ